MEFTLDKTLGYMYSYSPTHELANSVGKVYEHVYVMVNHIGRKLLPTECVHHIDRNRANNSMSNLLLLTNIEHSQLHWIEKFYLREGAIKTKQDLYDHIHLLKENLVEKHCPVCGALFECSKAKDQIYCSALCYGSSRKIDIPKERLEFLIWNAPTTEVARKLGVSNVALNKRCKSLGISKPLRGYWAKKRAGKI